MLLFTYKPKYCSALFASLFIFACSQNAVDLTSLKDAKNNFHAITHIYDKELTGSDKIPIFIKDNIDSIGAPNTAGSLALLDNIPSQDAFLVAQLKAKNYRVIGKTNLSEWANFRSFDSISGWSSYGGQTIHSLGNNFNPCGSSSGSAVVVALGLVKASIGTETNGSISCPASVNGIVGISQPLV